MPFKGYKQTEDHIEKKRLKSIGNKSRLGIKKSKLEIEKISVGMKKIFDDPKERERISISARKMWQSPSDELLSTLDNSIYGTKCYSDDGLYLQSLQERDCYYWARDDVKEVVEVKKFGRIDFIITLVNGDKVALEYHPKAGFDREERKNYYEKRRKLLNELGYRDLKLIVMTSLKGEEKERVEKYFKKIITRKKKVPSSVLL